MKHLAAVLAVFALLLIAFPAASQPANDASQTASESDALREAWQLPPRGLDADIAKMNEQWDAVEAQLADAAHIKIRAGKVSNWSVGQQSLHILKVANAIGGQLPGLLDSDAPGLAGGSPMKDQALAHGFPRGVAQAPLGLGVHYQPDLEEIQQTLKQTRDIWNAVIARRDAIPSATATFPHPVFGPMNAAEWLRFTTVHTSHHLKIIGDILADHEARTANAAPEPEPATEAATVASPTPVSRSGSGAFAAAADSGKPATADEATATGANPGRPVYAVALLDIHDRAEYRNYEMGFLPILAKYGGELLAVDENVQPVEGAWPSQRTVILRFESRAALDRWYNSPEYQKILPHRHASSSANIAVVQGLPLRAPQ